MPHVKTAVKATQEPDSISELEYCVLKEKAPRTILNWRKSGKMPPYYLAGRQIRYRLSDIESHEQNQGA